MDEGGSLATRPRRGALWILLAVIVLAGVASTLYYRGGWAAPSTRWSTDIGDPEQMIWFLAWTPHILLRGHDPFLTTYGLYPFGANLMWNTSIIFPAVLLSPVTLLFGPVVSYNVLLTLAPVLTAGTTYLAFLRWVRSPIAAGVGGLAFGFCPFLLIQQLGHQQLTFLALFPLTFALLDEAFVRQLWRPWVTGGLLGVVAAAQLLTSEEILTIESMVAVVALVSLCALRPRQVTARIPHAIRTAGVAVGVFVVLVALPLGVQLLGPDHRLGFAHPTLVYSADLANFVQPFLQRLHLNVVHQPLPFAQHEATAYLGFPLLLILVIAVVIGIRRRLLIVPVAAICLVVFVVLSTGPKLHIDGQQYMNMPWNTIGNLPLVKDVLPVRLTVVVDFCAALLLAVFVDALLVARWPLRAGAAALVVAMAATWIPAPTVVSAVDIPTFFTTSAENQVAVGSVAVVTPYVFSPFYATAMVWQAAGGMRFRMIEGYLGNTTGDSNGPPTVLSQALSNLQTRPVHMSAGPRTAILSYLQHTKVDEIIVGPGPVEYREVAFFRRLLGTRPRHTAGVWLWLLPSRSGRAVLSG